MRRLVVIAVLGAALVAVALVARDLGAGAELRDAAPVAATASVGVTFDAAQPGVAIAPSFLGFSVEWDSVATYAGAPGRRRAQLLRVLAPLRRAAGPLALRVGGDTADQAWWNPAGRPRPVEVLQDITPATLRAVAWLRRGLGGPVTLDVNLAMRDPRNALALVRAARRRLPRGALETVEIGNEPDLYTRSRTFHVPGHVHRRLRKHGTYGPDVYGRDAASYLAVLSRELSPPARLAVAGFAGPKWWSALPGLLRRWGDGPGAVSGHLYALPRCGGAAPHLSWLLSTEASRARARALAPLAAIARRHNLPLRITELNSAACGGRRGLSDTFAAGLWLTDTLFALVREGAVQADVHTWAHARYEPFAVFGADAAKARPPLVGMVAFARAAPAGSRLIAVAAHGAQGVRAWATVDGGGTVRIALIAASRARVTVAAPGRGCGSVWIASRTQTRERPVCPRNERLVVALPLRSLGVLTLPPNG